MKQAFTLIELLIVIALIAMMVVVAVPQFSKFGKRSELTLKAEEFELLFVSAEKFASNPELNYNGMSLRLNYSSGISSIANKATFDNKDKPWAGASTKLWQEVRIPSDMFVVNTISSELDADFYFVSPGDYVKKNSNEGIGFRLCFEEVACLSGDVGDGDFVNIQLFPTNTSDTSDQNFKVIVNESWR